MKKKPPPPPIVGVSLCYRCEYRAVALEDKLYGRFEGCPRYQCGLPEYSAIDCYMFKPTKPPILAPSATERQIKIFQGMKGRPRFIGAALSGRESAVGLPKCKIAGKVIEGVGVVLWQWPTRKVEGGKA